MHLLDLVAAAQQLFNALERDVSGAAGYRRELVLHTAAIILPCRLVSEAYHVRIRIYLILEFDNDRIGLCFLQETL
ncbi:hypothetical protein D1872_303990 [compost metagenome]